MNNNFNIQKFIDIDYATDERKARRKGANGTQEFFSPYSIVKKMCDKIPEEDWSDPTKTFLDPAMGNGNIILVILYRRIVEHVIDWRTALETLYGVELMQDNVDETKERIIDLLNKLNIEYDKDVAYEIMNRNLVCSDFFKWNFEEWRPYREDELK